MKVPKAVLLLPFLASFAIAKPPTEESVQGLYEGSWKDATGSADAEVRIVAMGKGTFKLLARRKLDGKIVRAEIDGKTDAKSGSITFAGSIAGSDCKVSYKDGAIAGTIGKKGSLSIKRIERTPPTLGKKPPAGAIVLIDGKNFDNMKARSGEWIHIDKKDGSIQVPKGGMNSVKKIEGDYDAHVEFNCNLRATARGQGRGNSGFYLANRNEIQVLDSFGAVTYLGGGCGGLYKFKNPDVMEPIPSLVGKKDATFNFASLPPLQWQAYDVEYRVKKGGKKALMTAHHNGIKIHDKVELNHKAGTFHFQDHGNPVRYRNIWVLEKK